jgi:hypothetical protein
MLQVFLLLQASGQDTEQASAEGPESMETETAASVMTASVMAISAMAAIYRYGVSECRRF